MPAPPARPLAGSQAAVAETMTRCSAMSLMRTRTCQIMVLHVHIDDVFTLAEGQPRCALLAILCHSHSNRTSRARPGHTWLPSS